MSPAQSQDPATSPARPTSTVGVLMRLMPFVRPALPRMIGGIVAATIGMLVALLIPQALRGIVDGAIASGDTQGFWLGLTLILVLGITEAGMVYLRRMLVLRPNIEVERQMRVRLFERLLQLPVAFHDRWQSGQLLSRAVSDLNRIRRWLAFGIVLLVTNILTILVGFGLLISLNLWVGVVFMVVCIPIWFFGYWFERRYRVLSRLGQDKLGDLATNVEESVHGIRVLKAFGRGPFALAKFADQAEELQRIEVKRAGVLAQLWMSIILIPDIAFGAALLFGIWQTVNGSTSIGTLVAFFATAGALRWPIESIGFLLAQTAETRTATERYFEVMDEPNPIEDPAEPKTIERPEGRLAFRDVHFRYDDAPASERDLIDGVDLEVEPGETMALIGLTGSGKTTLTTLPPRLYDVTGGSVEIDGIDVRELPQHEVRRLVGMAFEEPVLFSASVRDNVLMGHPDGTDVDVERALDIAQASFVNDLPEGLDTMIGEEGMSLSGGQRQRLALARAIAARPAILVLDDPLSALDVDTEARVQEALGRVLTGTTALIVAHRPSTVMLADRVALVQHGRIAAVGRHADLITSNPDYRFVIASLEDEDERRRDEDAKGVRTTSAPPPGRVDVALEGDRLARERDEAQIDEHQKGARA